MEVEARLLRLEDRSERMQKDITEIKDQLKIELPRLNSAVTALTVKVASIETKIETMEKWLETKFETLEAKFDTKLSAMDSTMTRWMVATIIAAVGLACAIAKVFG